MGNTATGFKIPHNRLTFGQEESDAIAKTVATGRWAMGPRIEELEKTISTRAGMPYGVCVSSGLSALILSLRGMKIGLGDEVIIPAYSFVALVDAILIVGATPVAADIRSTDYNIDPDTVRKAITPKTKAILTVNTFGIPAPLEEMEDLQVPLLEDCAHGFAVEYKGRPMGGRSAISILSFYATKPMGGGEGGIILTTEKSIADVALHERDYENLEPSAHLMNYKMNDLEATLALVQYGRYDNMLQRRQELADRYDDLLKETAATGIFSLPEKRTDRVWYRYAINMKPNTADAFMEHLASKGIQAIRPVDDWRRGQFPDFPVANEAYKNVVSIPLYPTLTNEEQDTVIAAIRDAAVSLS